MVDQESFRKSGKTTAEEEVAEQAKEFSKPIGEEKERPLLSPTFHRMRVDIAGPNAEALAKATAAINKRIRDEFSDAYDVMFEVYLTVRNPVVDEENGEVLYAPDGMPQWEKTESGGYVEDWTRLNHKERERFLYMIITRMFDWEQKAADIWGEAVFAKGIWEEVNAIGFESLVGEKHTVEYRKARGIKLAAEDRYIGIYRAILSKKADALVRSMDRISQRLKDIHTA